MRQDELYHYGVLGMKWGVRRYQPYGSGGYTPKDKGGSFKPSKYTPEQRKAGIDKHYEKAVKKLAKIDKKYEAKRAQADKNFSKAERVQNSLLGSQRSVNKFATRGSKAQYKANRLANKGKRWVSAMEKTFGEAGKPLDQQTIDLGKKYTQQLATNSAMLYTQMAVNYRR